MLEVGYDWRTCNIHQIVENHQNIPVGTQCSEIRGVDVSSFRPSLDKDSHLPDTSVDLTIAFQQLRVVDGNEIGKVDVALNATIALKLKIRLFLLWRWRQSHVQRRISEFCESSCCSFSLLRR